MTTENEHKPSLKDSITGLGQKIIGEIETIDPSVIQTLSASGFVPVIAPIGSGRDGETYNINVEVGDIRDDLEEIGVKADE